MNVIKKWLVKTPIILMMIGVLVNIFMPVKVQAASSENYSCIIYGVEGKLLYEGNIEEGRQVGVKFSLNETVGNTVYELKSFNLNSKNVSANLERHTEDGYVKLKFTMPSKDLTIKAIYEELAELEGGEEESSENDISNETPLVVPVILDVDMDTDIDDVIAVRIAEELDVQGVIDIIGFSFSSTPDRSGNNIRAAEGLLDYAGLTDVPVADCAVDLVEYGDYWGTLWDYKKNDHKTYKNAVDMYKDVLNALPSGQKARIVTTGSLVNIEALLKDEAGYELVKTKVDSIFVAGGSDGLSWNLAYKQQKIDATVYVNKNCPVSIYYVQDSLGATMVGGHLTLIDENNTDILSKAFEKYGIEDGENYGNCDGTAVYCAAYKDSLWNGYYNAVAVDFYVNSSNGNVTAAKTLSASNRYRMEASKALDEKGSYSKYVLYDSQIYTDLYDSLIESDYYRKNNVKKDL